MHSNTKKLSYEDFIEKVQQSDCFNSVQAKEFILWLIDQTDELKREVVVTIPFGQRQHGSLALSVYESIVSMTRGDCKTKLNDLLSCAGCDYKFMSFQGGFVPRGFDMQISAYTVWFAMLDEPGPNASKLEFPDSFKTKFT